MAGIANSFAFIGEILIVTRGEQKEHMDKKQVLKRLYDVDISLKNEKCTFGAKQIEWVGYKLSQKGFMSKNS